MVSVIKKILKEEMDYQTKKDIIYKYLDKKISSRSWRWMEKDNGLYLMNNSNNVLLLKINNDLVISIKKPFIDTINKTLGIKWDDYKYAIYTWIKKSSNVKVFRDVFLEF